MRDNAQVSSRYRDAGDPNSPIVGLLDRSTPVKSRCKGDIRRYALMRTRLVMLIAK